MTYVTNFPHISDEIMSDQNSFYTNVSGPFVNPINATRHHGKLYVPHAGVHPFNHVSEREHERALFPRRALRLRISMSR